MNVWSEYVPECVCPVQKRGGASYHWAVYVLCLVVCLCFVVFADCCIGIGGKKIMSCRIPHCTALNCAVNAAGPALPAGNK